MATTQIMTDRSRRARRNVDFAWGESVVLTPVEEGAFPAQTCEPLPHGKLEPNFAPAERSFTAQMLRGLRSLRSLTHLVAPALVLSGSLVTLQNPPATCAPTAEVLSKLFISGDEMHSALMGGPKPNHEDVLHHFKLDARVSQLFVLFKERKKRERKAVFASLFLF